MAVANEMEGLPVQSGEPWCGDMPCMVFLPVLGLAESQQWARHRTSHRTTEELVDVMREGMGSSHVSEWYHLLYFHFIKFLVFYA